MSQTSIVEKLQFDHSKLVDTDLFTDVTFTFPSRNEGDGAAPNAVKAHKAFLISVSSVFHTMFCGSLPPTTNEVAIEDISRDDFIEVLRHIYGSKATINFENVYGIWYAAQKYLLDELMKKCAKFVQEAVTSSNVLDVFNTVQLFDSREVDKKCLNLLLDCPQQYLEAKGIVKLNKDAFRKFIRKLKYNCSVANLKAIGLEWLNAQKQTEFCCFSDKVQEIFEKEFNIHPKVFEITKKDIPGVSVNYLDSTLFHNVQCDLVQVRNTTCFDQLHGIGIYVGIYPDDVPMENSEWVVIEVKREVRAKSVQLLKKTILVQQEYKPSILPVMFSTVYLGGKVSISIRFPAERRRAINPMSWKKKNLGKLSLPAETTCIAYLIEKPFRLSE